MEAFAQGLFVHCNNEAAFKQHLRDFLVELKEFKESDNSELFVDDGEREKAANKRMAVPGLVRSAPS